MSVPSGQSYRLDFVAASTTATPADGDEGEEDLCSAQDINKGTRTSLLDALLDADEDSFNFSMDDIMASFSFSLDQQPPTPSPEVRETLDEPVCESMEGDDECEIALVNSQQGVPQQQSGNYGTSGRRRLIVSEEPEDGGDWKLAEEIHDRDAFIDRAVETLARNSHRQNHPRISEDNAQEEDESEEEQYQSQASSPISDHHTEHQATPSTLFPPGQHDKVLAPSPEADSPASTLPMSPLVFDAQQGVEVREDERMSLPIADTAAASPPTFDSLQSYFLGHDSIFHSQEHTQEYLPATVAAGAAGVSGNDKAYEYHDDEPLVKRQKATPNRSVPRGTVPVADAGATPSVPTASFTSSHVKTFPWPSSPSPSRLSARSAPRLLPVKNPILSADLIAPLPADFLGGRTTEMSTAVEQTDSGTPGPSTSNSLLPSSKTATTSVATPLRAAMPVGATTPASPRPKRIHIPLTFEERPPAMALPPAMAPPPTTTDAAPSMSTANEDEYSDRRPPHQAATTSTGTAELMRELSEVNRDFARRRSSLPAGRTREAAPEERYSLTQTTFYKQRQPGYIPVPSFQPRYQRSRKKKTTRERVESPRGVKFSSLVTKPILTEDSDIHLSDILQSQPLSASQQHLPASVEAA
ncbi:hypothetical protein BGZ73_004882 [Actinomortierella ambigua]|nr:hypothetical protein BGZ73_004882 [Actinomortierella ambigua]